MIEKTIKHLLAKQLDINSDKISNDSDIINDLGADSLDIVELVMSIEDSFKIRIDDEDYHDRRTIRQLIEMIESKISQ